MRFLSLNCNFLFSRRLFLMKVSRKQFLDTCFVAIQWVIFSLSEENFCNRYKQLHKRNVSEFGVGAGLWGSSAQFYALVSFHYTQPNNGASKGQNVNMKWQKYKVECVYVGHSLHCCQQLAYTYSREQTLYGINEKKADCT